MSIQTGGCESMGVNRIEGRLVWYLTIHGKRRGIVRARPPHTCSLTEHVPYIDFEIGGVTHENVYQVYEQERPETHVEAEKPE
jgi:hypothetical protein